MKRLKVCSLITAALVSASMTAQYSSIKVSASTNNSTNAQITSAAQVADNIVTVDVTNSNSSATTNTLNPKFKITNTSGEAIDLSTLNLKYYYNSDGSEKQNFWCDYSGTTSGNYQNFTGNVVGTFNSYTDNNGTGTNTYLQVGFNGGTLEAGQTMEVNTRIAKENWSNYDQSNDYSFNANNASPWDKVTAEAGGKLIWGQPPTPPVVIPNSDIDVKQADVKLSAAQDIVENLTLNGNEFVGIKNGSTSLVEGTDYTVDGTKVTISKDYLKKLPEGATNLVFDFNQGNDPVLVINAIGERLDVTVGSVKGKTGETVTVPVKVSGIPADKGVYGYNFALSYDTTKLTDVKVAPAENCPNPEATFKGTVDAAAGTIKVSYMNSTMDDDKSETLFTDGVIVNLTFTIKEDAPKGVTPITVSNKGDFAYVQNVTDIGKYKVNYKNGQIEIQRANVKDSVIDPTNATFETTAPKDVNVGVTYNGNTLDAIKDASGKVLTAGKEYTIVDGKVIFSKDYLSTLPLGQAVFTFDFSDGADPTLTIDVKEEHLDLSIGKVEGKQGTTVTVPVKVSGIPADKGVYGYNFALKYDTTKFSDVKVTPAENCPNPESTFRGTVDATTGTIKVSYMNSTMDDDKSETLFTDGVLVNVTLTIKSDATPGVSPITVSNKGDFAYVQNVTDIGKYKVNYGDGQVNIIDKGQQDPLSVAIGKVDAKQGETVTVPVSLKGVPADKGVYGYNFALKYDTTKFSDVKVSAGEDCPNPESTFRGTVDATTGTIKVSYMNSTMDDNASETIFKDGVIVNVTFTVKKDAAVGTTPITVSNKGDFAAVQNDTDITKYPVNYTEGAVNILEVKADALDLQVGKVDAKQGETVTVPVSLKGIPADKGVYGYNFSLKYDTTKFSDVKVSAGEDCPNAESTFRGTVDTATGTIKVSYMNSTMDDDPTETIFKDGVIVNVTFTVKSDAAVGTTPITVSNKGDFAAVQNDTDITKYAVNYTEGAVNITSAPVAVVDSKLDKSSADFDLSKPADISVGVTLNGNTLSGIKDASGTALPSGAYKVSGNTVVLSQSYLSTLPVGKAVLTFDFNQGTDQTLTVNVSKSVVIVDSKLDKTSVDNNLSKPADISVGVTFNGNTLSGIKDASGKAIASTAYTISGNTVVLSKDYLSTLPVGATVLTFDFNQGADQTLTVNSKKDDPISTTTKVTTDAVNVKAGDTFKVPVLIKNAPAAGIAGMSVNVKYDSTVLTCTGYTYGGLITSPKTDFFGSNLTAKSTVIMNYYDANNAGTAIKADGVFAILTFKVNATAAKGATTITENKATVLSDASGKAYPVSVEFGKINVQ